MRLAFIFLLFTVTACSSVTVQEVPVATINNLEEGNALILVERYYESEGSVHEIEVSDNGSVVGNLGVGSGSKNNRRYHQLVWQRPAGSMTLELTSGTLVAKDQSITKEVVAGKMYTFIVRFKYSPYGFHLLEE